MGLSENIINPIVLIVVFIFGISFIPKFVYVKIRSLLFYNRYEKENLKKNFYKIFGLYVLLGLSQGVVFIFLLNNLSIKNLELKPTQKIIFSFLISFLLIIVLRVSVLLNKTEIVKPFLSEDLKKKMLERSKNYPYEELRKEFESFLFSIFSTALIGILIYSFYSILFIPEDSWQLVFQGKNIDFLWVFVSIILFGFFRSSRKLMSPVSTKQSSRNCESCSAAAEPTLSCLQKTN